MGRLARQDGGGIRSFAADCNERIFPAIPTTKGEAALHLDLILLIALATLAVWTEVDKLRKQRKPQ